MAKIIPITEHFQHFPREMKESFWGDVYGQTTTVWKQLLELDSQPQRDRYAVRAVYQRRRSRRQPYRNGYYERDFVTRFGTIRLRVARTREKSFLPCEDGCPGDLLGREPRPGGSGVSPVPGAVAPGVWGDGAATGTRLTGAAVVLRFSPSPVAKTAYHQRDRALLRGSAAENPAHGVLCERRKCGSHHLLHFPEIQPGMENPHPLRIHTSSLTSPVSQGY
jgi:Transposase, Mutator family